MKQEEKIWEWCGVNWLEGRREESTGNLILEPPKLTLDNLFKYAVPKLPYIFVFDCAEGGWACFIRGCDGAPDKAEGYSKDPAEALAQAILKVIENE